MYFASNLLTNKRSKHIDLTYHLIRDCAKKGVIGLECISTKRNVANIVTKPLQRMKHSYFTSLLLQDQEICIPTISNHTHQGIIPSGGVPDKSR